MPEVLSIDAIPATVNQLTAKISLFKPEDKENTTSTSECYPIYYATRTSQEQAAFLLQAYFISLSQRQFQRLLSRGL